MNKGTKRTDLEGAPDYTIFELREKKSKYCLCIFALNEKGRIDSELLKIRHISNEWDVILADGGSTDGTNDLDFLRENNLKALLIKNGPGKLGAQMRMAFHYAMELGYEGVIVVDGNDKDDIARSFNDFTNKLDQGYDHIQGSRYIVGGIHENTPRSRHFAVRFIHAPAVSLAAGFMCTDTTNGFRAYSAKLLRDPKIAIMRDELSGYELHYYLAIEAANQGFKLIEVPVTRSYPDSGKIPSKIVGMSGNFKVLKTLHDTVMGCYRKGADHSYFGKLKDTFGFLVGDRLPVSFDTRIVVGMISLFMTLLFMTWLIPLKEMQITNFNQRTIGQVVLDGINADHRNKIYVVGFVLAAALLQFVNRGLLFLSLFVDKTFGKSAFRLLGTLSAVALVPLALAKFDSNLQPIRNFFTYPLIWLLVFFTITSVRGYFDPYINSFCRRFWRESVMLSLFPVTLWLLKDLFLHGIINLSNVEFLVIYFTSLVLSISYLTMGKNFAKLIYKSGRLQMIILFATVLGIFIGQESQFFLSQKGIVASYQLTGALAIISVTALALIFLKKILSYKFEFAKCIIFPAMLFCFFLARNYKLSIELDLFDWFHLPERVIPVQQYLGFGKIPWFDLFATHGFSDASYGWIWTLLGGDSGIQFMAWEYFFTAALYLGVYYVLLSFVSPLSAFLIALALAARFLTDTSSTSIFISALFLLPAILFFKYEKSLVIKIITGFLVFFTFFYYPTIGVPIIASLVFAFLGLSVSRKINFKFNLLALSASLLILVAGLAGLFLLSEANLVSTLKLWMEFVTIQAQSMSYSSMTNGNLTQEILMYFLQPGVFVIFGLIYLQITFKQRKLEFWEIAFLILTCFYVVHFTRLIQRHSLIEMCTYEGALVLSVFYIYGKVKRLIPGSIDIYLLCFVSLGEVVVPSYLGIPLSSELVRLNNWQPNQKRVVFKKQDRDNEIVRFLNQNLKENETFYDFSNSPALYMLTDKEFPTFYIPQIYHTSQASQQRVIDDLSEKIKSNELKYVVFSRLPDTGMWSNLDTVPSRLRSFLISEFIYKNFYRCQPMEQWDLWCVNGSKNLALPLKSNTVNFNKLPLIWGKYDKKLKPVEEHEISGSSFIITPDRETKLPLTDFEYWNSDYLELKACSVNGTAKVKINLAGSQDQGIFTVEECGGGTNLAISQSLPQEINGFCDKNASGVINVEYKCSQDVLVQVLKFPYNIQVNKYDYNNEKKFLAKFQVPYACPSKADKLLLERDAVLAELGCKVKSLELFKTELNNYLVLLNVFEFWNSKRIDGINISSDKKILISSAKIVKDSSFYELAKN